jgi:hypothetical protein
MAYIRRWRKYHAVVASLAQSSDEEVLPYQNISTNYDGNACISNSSSNENYHESVSDRDNYVTDDTDVHLDDSENGAETSTDSDNSDDQSASDFNNVPDLIEDLSGWATRNGCTRSALNDLLFILRKQGLRVPKDARTLLQTPRRVNTIQKLGGDYLYLGIESGILKVISTHLEYFRSNNEVILTFNVDGVPLFKSSNVQMWPILCSVQHFEPFVVAFYCGNSKPNSVVGYLDDFLSELKDLAEDGIRFEEKNLKVSVSSFVCDAPARSFLKCTKGHNAYYACERCVIKGKWEGRVVFGLSNIDTMPSLRSETSFNNFEYRDHQMGITPLINAGISCIKSFPLDYMHLVCLGVVKRLLMFLKSGPRICRLSHQQLELLSEKLCFLNGKMPREFARQPRSHFYLDRWKATEFRQFLLYTGPLVLRPVVSKHVYEHFLSLTVAMSILLHNDVNFRNVHTGYARELLVYFVKTSELIYGETFVSYNVHSLIHIADDVEHFGKSLNDISAFQFENHLQKLKISVRKAQNPIAQATKRIRKVEI